MGRNDAETSDPEPSPELRAFIRESLENDSDGSLKQFLAMPQNEASLVLACATARRIEGLCRALFGGAYLAARVQGDEYMYQHLRTSLVSRLGDNEELAQAKTIVLTDLPPTLPFEPDPVYDVDWAYGIEPACRKLEAELMRVAVVQKVNPYNPAADLFFETADRNIACIREAMASADRDFAAKLRLPVLSAPGPASGKSTPHHPTSSPKQRRRPPRRTGRPPVHLPYEMAQRVWWQLSDDLAPSKPNQQEFCDRLTSLGYPMSPRTLRDRIGTWRREELAWEPPRPTD